MEFKHIPVMLNECIEGLQIKENGIYFDGTLGGGGHTSEILKLGGKVIATDLDTDAINNAQRLIEEFGDKFTPVHSNFKEFTKVSNNLAIDKYDGVLLDLGVSSYQLDERERGFSYLADDVLLDMKMDKDADFSAYDLLNTYQEEKISKILWEYGEEKFHKVIAKNIVEERKFHPIKTCGDFVRIIEKSIPEKFKHDGHPAKRSFQAVRIEVNGELDGLYDVIIEMATRLKKGGRIAILTFHSLEDRIVKNAFKFLETDCICDKSLPICVCGKKKIVNLVNNKPIVATEDELKINSRSKSAKLRVAERV